MNVLPLTPNRVFSFSFLLLLLANLSACSTTTNPSSADAPTALPAKERIVQPTSTLPTVLPVQSPSPAPAAPREMRAAWVSTVTNIDWPSRRDLSSAQQQQEIRNIVETAAKLKLNTLILQVRPSADAIYPSSLEPWSEFLTGEQGKPPSPLYDPLQMWIDEAHAHGLQLHAWFNPYRAKSPSAKSALAPKHIGVRTPNAVKAYGDLLWMDPSSTQAQQQTLAVIRDVVRRYDIDGVHIDDYFYPYPIKGSDGTEVEFPDAANWSSYQQSGGELSRADWRREHVNQLVKAIHTTIHAEKAWMKFGISPFGIGRPDRLPTGIAGFSQYDKLYADVEYWLEQSWLDYLAPQLYWPIKQTAQAFPVLHDYWLAQNKQNRHIWPGLYTSRIDQSDKSWSADEIASQIELTRTKANAGHIHFSFKALMEDRKGISATLSKAQYQTMALVPSMPWLETNTAISAEQLKPILDVNDSKTTLKVSLPNLVNQQLLAIWKRYDQEWVFSVQAISQLSISLKPDALRGKLQEVTVSSVNRNGVESARSSFVLPELR